MTEGNIFLVDTNILIYYFDRADENKHNIARKLIDRCWNHIEKFALSSQNLSEFFSTTTTKKILSKQEAVEIISEIIEFEDLIKIGFDCKTVLEAAFISKEYNMTYWDSLLTATMKQNSVLNLYTENSQHFKVPWLNVINPFENNKRIKKD